MNDDHETIQVSPRVTFYFRQKCVYAVVNGDRADPDHQPDDPDATEDWIPVDRKWTIRKLLYWLNAIYDGWDITEELDGPLVYHRDKEAPDHDEIPGA